MQITEIIKRIDKVGKIFYAKNDPLLKRATYLSICTVFQRKLFWAVFVILPVENNALTQTFATWVHSCIAQVSLETAQQGFLFSLQIQPRGEGSQRNANVGSSIIFHFPRGMEDVCRKKLIVCYDHAENFEEFDRTY